MIFRRTAAALAVVFVGCAYLSLRGAPLPRTAANDQSTHELGEASSEKREVASTAPLKTNSVANTDPIRSNAASIQAAPSVEMLRALDEMKRVRECYDSHCNFPSSYPREYNFAVGKALKASVLEIARSAANDRFASPDLSQIAQESLANDDGHVKEAGLTLMATQPPSAQNLQAILNGVIDDIDARLVSQALNELNRYPDPADRRLIQERLGAALKTGAPFVSEAISKSIGAFIDAGNVDYFASLASQARPGSIVAANLRALVADFRRRSKGA